MKRIPIMAVLWVGVAAGSAAEALRSPWDEVKVTATDVAYACPAAPVFAETLDPGSYYIDAKASVIDPKKFAAYQAVSDAPTHLGQFVTKAADAYLSKGNRSAAKCVFSLLASAATAKAWTGRMPDYSGVYIQNWELSGTAVAYLKVRHSGVETKEQDEAILRWFRLLSGRVKTYFDAQGTEPDSDAWNNHMYWAGLSVAAEGIANNDRRDLQWGVEAYRRGVGAIQADGSLAKEMVRGQRALHYHLYSLGPLIMLAELGAANGMELYGEDHGAIHRLAMLCLAGVDEPGIFEKRTGVAQVVDYPLSGMDIGWGVPYVRRFPNARIEALIAKAPWTGFWQWGGAPPG